MPENFLKKIREAKKVGQSELALKAGVSKQLLSGFENGRSGISNQVLKKLAAVLGVSPDSIMTGRSNEPFDDNGRKKLSEAMSMAFKFYGDEFNKETMVQIAAELYGIMIDYEAAKKDSNKKIFKKSLEEKIAIGLAAKCFLNFKNKNL